MQSALAHPIANYHHCTSTARTWGSVVTQRGGGVREGGGGVWVMQGYIRQQEQVPQLTQKADGDLPDLCRRLTVSAHLIQIHQLLEYVQSAIQETLWCPSSNPYASVAMFCFLVDVPAVLTNDRLLGGYPQ